VRATMGKKEEGIVHALQRSYDGREDTLTHSVTYTYIYSCKLQFCFIRHNLTFPRCYDA
jgi:hypothetical protein